MNLRNRLIWIAALSVAFAGVQLVASRRKAEQERVEYLTGKLAPATNECIRLAHDRSPSLRGVLTVQVDVVPDGKLAAVVDGVEVPASSELQERELTECIRERVKTLKLPMPLRGPERVQLAFAVEPAASEPSR